MIMPDWAVKCARRPVLFCATRYPAGAVTQSNEGCPIRQVACQSSGRAVWGYSLVIEEEELPA